MPAVPHSDSSCALRRKTHRSSFPSYISTDGFRGSEIVKSSEGKRITVSAGRVTVQIKGKFWWLCQSLGKITSERGTIDRNKERERVR